MSWWADKSLTWFQNFSVNVIKCGPVPHHVAFIMDGNRRFARKQNMEVQRGHHSGLGKLKDITFWCKEFGIREVTVYGFSIDNFKRSATEVNDIMDITRKESSTILEKLVDFLKDGICIRVIGNLDLLPVDVRKFITQVTNISKNNKTLILNVAYSYTARDEITNAIKIVADGVRSGSLAREDIDEDLLTQCMYTNRSPDPEMIVRTSGETRFSDFLLWQAQNSNIFIEDVTWPELGFWTLLKIIFQYQRNYKETQKNRITCETKEPSVKRQRFLKKLEYTRARLLQRHLNS